MSITTTKVISVGGGIASFSLVDALRVSGLAGNEIMVVGKEERPYDNFLRYCVNSGINYHDRLRSDSAATPGNIWGWPSFGMREMTGELASGHPVKAAKVGLQLLSEPVLSDTYTPKLIQVINGIDREARRINYTQSFAQAEVTAIARHDNQWLVRAQSKWGLVYLQAPILHLATGYQNLHFPWDRQLLEGMLGENYRHAYQEHEHIMMQAKYNGGVVIVRGRGIAATKVIERLLRITPHQKRLQVVQLIRGSDHKKSKMPMRNQRYVQPFNFPKSSFGGDQAELFIKMTKQQRLDYIAEFGRASTPTRRQWEKQIDWAVAHNQFALVEGSLGRTKSGALGLFDAQGTRFNVQISAVIDATGLERKPMLSAPIRSLASRNHLVVDNKTGILAITDSFEVISKQLENSNIFVSGMLALGGPFAGVDSFSGINFASQVSTQLIIERLNQMYGKTRKTPSQNSLTSLRAWCRWAAGVTP